MAVSTNAYITLSFTVLALVVIHSWQTRVTFYRTMAHLYTSKAARFSAINAGVAGLFSLGRLVQAIFLGPLRFVEVERMNFRAREAALESFLAMTVFSRNDLNTRFLIMFGVTFLIKVFHWLCYERLSYVEQRAISLEQPRLTHGRLMMLFVALHVMDVCMLMHCFMVTREQGPSIMAMFAFEYAILLIGLASHAMRYVIFLVDTFWMEEGSWENKGTFLFCSELVSTLLQLCVYFAFFAYVHLFYSLPIHIMRDMAVTFRNFRRRLLEFTRYRRVVRSMQTQFPDATEDDLAAADRTCIICREEMHGDGEAKKLRCGHMFHTRCLRSWMERSMSCPTCRNEIRSEMREAEHSSSAAETGDRERPVERATEVRESQSSPDQNVQRPSRTPPTILQAVPPPPPPPPELLPFLEHAIALSARTSYRSAPITSPFEGSPADLVTPLPTATPVNTAQSVESAVRPSSSRRSSVTLTDARQLQRQLDDLAGVMRNLIQRLEAETEEGEDASNNQS